MNRFLLGVACAFLLVGEKPKQPDRIYPVVDYRVIDGDTIETTLDLGFDVLYRSSARIKGIDAPEISTGAGQKVKAVVEAWMKDRPCWSQSFGNDKYGGRYDGSIMDSKSLESLKDMLLNAKIVHDYNGKKRVEWTADELQEVERKCDVLLGGKPR